MKPDKSIRIKLRNTAYPALIFLFFITLCFIIFSSSERELLRKSAEQSLSDISRMVYKRLKSTPNFEVTLDEVKRTVNKIINL